MEPPATDRTKRQTSHEFYKKLCKLTVAGGLAFWIVDFAISLSPIAAEYMAAFSISSLPMALVEALVGGLIIACFVSYFLLRFFDRIPTRARGCVAYLNPFVKIEPNLLTIVMEFLLIILLISVVSTVFKRKLRK